ATGDVVGGLKTGGARKPEETKAAMWQQLADAQSAFDPRKDWGKA
ncbi:DNA-binding protein, partial [Escherichia coli]|nr:DNA-binding protein [Escherichia coli]